jgi:hypothetical protein
VFGPQVRGWNFDGTGLTSIAKINFNPWTGQYGANVSAGDVDEDGFDEIGVGRGSGPSEVCEVRVFDYDGSTVTGLPGWDIVIGTTRWGAQLSFGSMAGDVFDQSAEAFIGAGPDPSATSAVYVYEAGAQVQTWEAIAGASYGANVGTGGFSF